MDTPNIISKFKKFRIVFAFLIIFAASFSLHYPSLHYYFFQDDWFVLNWVRTGNFASFFAFRDDIIYWRPLSMPLFFLFGYSNFGLNPVLYHILAFLIFFVLLISIYYLSKLLLRNSLAALSITFFYATWPIHFISLSWLSTTSYILMTLFQVISFASFILFVNQKKYYFYLFSILSFLLALLSLEFTLVLPIILIIWGYIYNKKIYFKYLALFFVIDIIFVVFRFLIYPLSNQGPYELSLNKMVLNNYLWYLGWAVNLPERFKELINQRSIQVSINTLLQFWKISLPAIIFVLLSIKLLIKSFTKNKKHIIFGFFWFTVGLIPILPLINHSYSVYLSFGGLCFLYVLTILLNNNIRLWIIFGVLWIISSFTNLQFTRNTHWIVNEQAVSRVYINLIQEKVPDPQDNSIFIIKEADSKFQKLHNFTLIADLDITKQSLNSHDAVQVIYNDSSLQLIYIKPLQPVDLPKNRQIYEIEPTI